MKSAFFPDPREANEFGVVCAGASPEPELLKDAYQAGIFPWPHRGYPLLWFSPDPRFVLDPKRLHLHRSLKKAMRKTTLTIKADTAFRDVMAACAKAKRHGQDGTWITRDMIRGYCSLHAEGFVHSIEAWDGDDLVGGLYGVSFGSVFFGESMFARAPDASKIAFATAVGNMVDWGFTLVDCQSYTDHLARFGAEDWPRTKFLAALAEGMKAPTRPGPWSLALQPAEALARLERHGIGE
jgi:leucyl/phenylalanyl-tRNA--protein transferase